MKIKSHFIYWLVICALVGVSFLCFNKDAKVEVVERHTTDTLIVYNTDTIKDVNIKYLTKRTIDTLYLDTTKCVLPLVVEQKHYANTDVYDLWVSGVEPLNLDSIKVYQKTEFITVTYTVEKEIYPKGNEIYVFGGLSVFNGTLSPKIGVSLKTKNEWLISPEIGLYDNAVLYGLTIGKKL